MYAIDSSDAGWCGDPCEFEPAERPKWVEVVGSRGRVDAAEGANPWTLALQALALALGDPL